jgi:hypothetical protein
MITGQVTTGWDAEKLYSVAYSTETRLINGLYGAVLPLEDVVHSDTGITSHYIGSITKDVYDNIAESITTSSALAFWNHDNTLKVRKIIVDFSKDTFLDDKRHSIVGLNNVVKLVAKCVDQHGAVWNDVPQVQIKNMAKREFAVSINGTDPATYKLSVPSNTEVAFTMQDQGRVTIRFKVVIPELSSVWLTVYPELYAYNTADLAAFTAWANSQPK